MGSGIVNLLLKNGFEAILWDINDQALQKGLSAVRKNFAYPIKKKKMTEKDLENLMAQRLTTTTSLQDLKEVDLVIEAVLGGHEGQAGYLETTGRHLPAHTVCSAPTPPPCPLPRWPRS